MCQEYVISMHLTNIGLVIIRFKFTLHCKSSKLNQRQDRNARAVIEVRHVYLMDG